MTTPLTESEARRYLRLSPTDEISPDDVKAAYRAAAKLHHPDAGSDPDPVAFAQAVEAAKFLKAGDRARPEGQRSNFDRIHEAAFPGDRASQAKWKIRQQSKYSAESAAAAETLRTSIDDLLDGLTDLAEQARQHMAIPTVRPVRWDDDGRPIMVIENLAASKVTRIEIDVERRTCRLFDSAGNEISHTVGP